MGFIFGGGGGSSAPAPVYDVEEEKKVAENNASEQNKKRIKEKTNTIKTSALGAASPAETARKTILGG